MKRSTMERDPSKGLMALTKEMCCLRQLSRKWLVLILTSLVCTASATEKAETVCYGDAMQPSCPLFEVITIMWNGTLLGASVPCSGGENCCPNNTMCTLLLSDSDYGEGTDHWNEIDSCNGQRLCNVNPSVTDRVSCGTGYSDYETISYRCGAPDSAVTSTSVPGSTAGRSQTESVTESVTHPVTHPVSDVTDDVTVPPHDQETSTLRPEDDEGCRPNTGLVVGVTVLVTLGSVLLTELVVVLIYLKKTNRYPFNKNSNKVSPEPFKDSGTTSGNISASRDSLPGEDRGDVAEGDTGITTKESEAVMTEVADSS